MKVKSSLQITKCLSERENKKEHGISKGDEPCSTALSPQGSNLQQDMLRYLMFHCFSNFLCLVTMFLCADEGSLLVRSLLMSDVTFTWNKNKNKIQIFVFLKKIDIIYSSENIPFVHNLRVASFANFPATLNLLFHCVV